MPSPLLPACGGASFFIWVVIDLFVFVIRFEERLIVDYWLRAVSNLTSRMQLVRIFRTCFHTKTRIIRDGATASFDPFSGEFFCIHFPEPC